MTDSVRPVLTPIHLAHASDDVVDQLVFAIASGRAKIGEKLPTIEEIAATARVSRPVVGAAFKVLADHGVLDVRRGSSGGARVLTNAIPVEILKMLQPLSRYGEATLMDVVEARRPIEESISLLAAARMSPEDANALGVAIEELRRSVAEPNRSFIYYDHLFHYRLGIMAANETLARIQHRLMIDSMVRMHEYGLLHDDRMLVVEVHEAVFEAVVSQDESAIVDATTRHWATSSGVLGVPIDAIKLSNDR